MNATSLEELRAAQSAAAAPQSPVDIRPEGKTASETLPDVDHAGDNKMEQIRQLLFGDQLALSAERLTALEVRQNDFEHNVLQRLDVISQRLDALSRDVQADRRAAFDELARAVHELGSRVRGI